MNKWLIKSAKEQIPLTIIYQAKDGKLSKRIILVKKISETSVLAYCFTKNQYRTFLTSQILAIEPYRKKRLPSA